MSSSATRSTSSHVRESIVFARVTTRSLETACRRARAGASGPLLSCADLANRLVSLRLEPARHPVPGDRRRALFADAVHATRRRFDVSAPMKALLVAWFALEAMAPSGARKASGRAVSLPRQARTGPTGYWEDGARSDADPDRHRSLPAVHRRRPPPGAAARAGMAERGHDVAVATTWQGACRASSWEEHVTVHRLRQMRTAVPLADPRRRRSATSRPSPIRSRSPACGV